VVEDYEDIDVKLSYLDGCGNVTGPDRFGRVADQLWADDSWSPVDEYRYTYDRAGNRTSRDNVLKTDHSLDETYTYDDLDRLKFSERGDDGQHDANPRCERGQRDHFQHRHCNAHLRRRRQHDFRVEVERRDDETPLCL